MTQKLTFLEYTHQMTHDHLIEFSQLCLARPDIEMAYVVCMETAMAQELAKATPLALPERPTSDLRVCH